MLLTTADGRQIEYAVTGEGPGLLLPQCNERWAKYGYVEVLAGMHRVVTASPRGYFGSSREADESAYTLEAMGNDVLAAADAAGLGEFYVWGYSLTSAAAAYLAMSSERVSALVAGGFPLVGSYDAILRLVKRNIALGRWLRWMNPRLWFRRQPLDPRAPLALYRGMAELPEDWLSRLKCPRLSYWGARDKVMSLGMPVEDQRSRLERAGFQIHQFAGLKHGSCLVRSDVVVPVVSRFLNETR